MPSVCTMALPKKAAEAMEANTSGDYGAGAQGVRRTANHRPEASSQNGGLARTR